MELRKYPNLNVETFARCNGKCVFCLASRSTRPRHPMPDKTFKKIVSEVAEWDEPFDFAPQGFSEPFLNPRWYEQYKYVQDNVPMARITTATNGTVLDDDNLDKLISIQKLTTIVLSVYAIRPDTYRDLMGTDPSNLMRLEHIADRISAERPDVDIIIGCSWSLISMQEANEFLAHWKQKRVKVIPHPMVITYKDSDVRDYRCNTPCPDPFATMMILNDGRSCGCCIDCDADQNFGNVNDKTILEIWNGTDAWRYRNIHTTGQRREIPVCRSCSRPCDMENYIRDTTHLGIYPGRTRHLFPSTRNANV